MEKELIDELKNLIEGDVETSHDVLESRSTDYSIFKILPKAVVFPRHSLDIQKLVRWVKEKKESGGYSDLSLTARAAGTCMSGGSLNESIIVDTTRYMTEVISVTRQDLGFQTNRNTGHKFPLGGFARVLPGTPYKIFEEETKKKGLIMPCFPASKNLCAVGGMAANNGAGEKTLKYGQNKDFVAELKAVFSDGNEYIVQPISKTELDAKMIEDTFEGRLYRSIWNLIQRNREEIQNKKPKTSKNSSGYLVWDVWDEETQIFDLTKLLVGAQGTTAIITEITYKLVPIEHYSNVLLVFLKDISHLPTLVTKLSSLDVETIEVYDKHTFSFAIKFFKDFVREKGFLGILQYMVSFLPEFWMFITGGIPNYVVLVEFVSNDHAEVEQEVKRAYVKIKGMQGSRVRILNTSGEIEKYWNIRRDSFKLLTDHSKKLRTAPFVDDIVVPVEQLPLFLPEITKLLDQEKLLYTIAGHLGNGNLHIIPLMDFNDPKTKEIILRLSPVVYEMVARYGGSMTAEHNDGLIRTPFLSITFGKEMVKIFQEIKESFDPRYIFNPKKKVGGNIADIEEFAIAPTNG